MQDWPHAPIHRFGIGNTYIVTAGTYLKKPLFVDSEKLTLLNDTVLRVSRTYGWELHAWAFLRNHYHIVGVSETDGSNLPRMIQRIHAATAIELNRLDNVPGRRVWFQYWDTTLTYEKSYLARLKYVHENPMKHGAVADARHYPWCSAAWFEATAGHSFYQTVQGFKTDAINMVDDFD